MKERVKRSVNHGLCFHKALAYRCEVGRNKFKQDSPHSNAPQPLPDEPPPFRAKHHRGKDD